MKNLARILAHSGEKRSTKTRKAVIELRDDRTKVQVDLQDADFNGDVSSPPYLVCEFRNGERYSFSLLSKLGFRFVKQKRPSIC
jgi:hypothetical protein